MNAPEGGPRRLKVRSRYPAVPDAWHAGQWPSRPVRGWSEGGRAQEGDGAGKGAVMGDAMRRGLIGGVERGGAKRQLSYREASTGDIVRHAGGRGLSHRPPGRLEGPCSPRHEALLAGAWKDLASLHRAALIRDHRRPRTAAAWRPRALARRAALRWYGSTRCAATRPAAAGPRSGCAGLFLAAAGRRRARRRSQQMRGEPRHVVPGAGGLRSASSRVRSSSRELQLAEGATFVRKVGNISL